MKGSIKKWIITLGSIGILSGLTIRLFNAHVDGVKSEREWYIKQLNFEFSNVIDVVSPGHIVFHVTNGDIDMGNEKRLVLMKRLVKK